MYFFVIVLTLVSQTADSLQTKIPVNRHYKTGTIISGTMSVACLAGAWICNSQANKVYDRYLHEVTFKRTAEDWNRVAAYDNMRNKFFIGAGFFLATAVYFHVRHMTSAKTAWSAPLLDFRWAENKLSICIRKHI